VLLWLFLAPGEAFLPKFARLLDEPVLHRRASSLLTGQSSATGTYRGRDVAATIQLKRGRHMQGRLVVAVRIGGDKSLPYDGIEARTRDEAGQRALFMIAANDLLLTVESGWLKALWKPTGFTMFPGSFSAEKWRTVLDAMSAVAASLETPA